MTVQDDVLHVVYRGFGPDWIASALIEIFGKTEAALAKAHSLAKSWARAKKVELSVDEFNIIQEKGYPQLAAKGYDIKLLILWLAPWRHLCKTNTNRCRFRLLTVCCLRLKSQLCGSKVASPRTPSWRRS